MVSLQSVTDKFLTPFTVVDGGQGTVMGTLSETDQTSQPSYVFVQPRHVFRTKYPTALRPGMVIKSPTVGSLFIVGDNGPAETWRGTLWQSFRLFEPTGRYEWRRRVKVVDQITNLPKDDVGQPALQGMIWAAIEAIDREQFDRGVHTSFEQVRFITGAPVLSDDLVDNRAVTKVDKQLGLSIGVLT